MAVSKTATGKQPKKTGGKISSFFKGVLAELKKVHWPTPKEIAIYTVVVIIAVAIAAIVLALMDLGFSAIFTKLMGF
ncbi:MAG: preprotein translocase subunit SecE [Bacillota bacterium]|jgi:preprotein translocase subunit SecE